MSQERDETDYKLFVWDELENRIHAMDPKALHFENAIGSWFTVEFIEAEPNLFVEVRKTDRHFGLSGWFLNEEDANRAFMKHATFSEMQD